MPPPRTAPATPFDRAVDDRAVEGGDRLEGLLTRAAHERGDRAVVLPALGEDLGLDGLQPLLEVDADGEGDAGERGEGGEDGQRDLAAGGDVEHPLVALEHRLEPVLEEVQVGREGTGSSNPPTMAEPGQHDERERHQPRRLVGLGDRVLVASGCDAAALAASAARRRRP